MGQEFPISGSIDPASFPFLLANLHQQGATGSLRVDGATYQKALYFRSGRILFGSSNDPRDQLGAILMESERLDAAQLDAASAKVGPGNPLAKVLADGGLVTQRELSDAAKLKVERILCDLLLIEEGNFEFEDDVLPKGAIDLKLSTQRLFVSALRRIDERAFVRRHLGGPEVVLGLVTPASERLAEIFGDVGGLPDVLDGRRSLREAAGLARLEIDDAGRLACALLFLGLAHKVAHDVFQAIESEDDELDFAATARIGLDALGADDAVAPATFESESGDAPFFLSNEPTAPPSASPAPVFAIDPAVFAPAPEPEPEIEPTLVLPRFSEATAIVPPPPRRPTPAPPPEPAVEPTVPLRAQPAPVPRPNAAGLPLVPPPARRPAPKPAVEEVEPTLATPAAARPSRADLEALDSLLNSRSIETPLSGATSGGGGSTGTPIGRRAPAWEPSFGRGAAPRGRKSAAPGGGRARLGLILAGIAALALCSVAGWYFLLRPRPTASTARAPVRARPSPQPTLAPSAPLVTPALATAASATTPVAATPAPVATPTSAPRATGPASLDDARALLRAGDLGPAARAFALHVRASSRDTFSIQLLLACSAETIGKAVAQAGAPELFIVPIRYRGRDCHRVCWGLYEGRARAESALRSVPPYFREGGATPKILTAAELLR